MPKQKPFEVSVEVTPNCNYSCNFCFASIFPKRNKVAGKKSLQKVLKKIAAEGISRVRFTGGEPLLRQDIVELVRFAKKQGLFTSLNTNASLLSEKKITMLAPFLDDILVSLHASDKKGEAGLGGKAGFFEKKLDAIKSLSKQSVFVRASTILSKENIASLEKFHKLVGNLPVNQWVLLRPIPGPAENCPVFAEDMEKAVEKITLFNKRKKKSELHLVENALPFCCGNPTKTSKIALGGLREDGHSSLFIDSGLAIKPSYFLDLKLGNALQDSIMSAWEHGFMQRMHSLEFIAGQCHNCRHVKRCMSGSRFSALLCNGSLYDLDPLARPEKYAKQLFS